MSHPFGDLLTQHLHRKHGLSQSKLAAGILQAPSIITDMSQGKRLSGPQARERVTAIIGWLQRQGALATLAEANALLNAAGMAPLQAQVADEALLIRKSSVQADPQQRLTVATPTPPRHNLPIQLTPFVGRTAQIAQLVAHLQTHRLLTLTGAGGVGKTRLALETAKTFVERQPPVVLFPDGVWFVDLVPLTNPEAIPQRILDLWRVPEQSESTPLATLIAYLSAKHALLILDNCEHLIDACAELAETLLQHCPQLSLLATSREALNIGGETPWRVPSLTRPGAEAGWDGQSSAVQPELTPEALSHFEAVALFVERAAVRQPGFALTTANAPAVAQICSRLDGIPLALEMAAARVNIFTVEELARRLDGAFAVFFMQAASFLAHQRDMQCSKGRSNAESLWGVHRVPSDTQIRNRLERLAPQQVGDCYGWVYEELQARQALAKYQSLDDTLVCALDGVSYFSWQVIHCDQGTQPVHGERVTDRPSVVAAVLVAPTQAEVISLEPEFL